MYTNKTNKTNKTNETNIRKTPKIYFLIIYGDKYGQQHYYVGKTFQHEHLV